MAGKDDLLAELIFKKHQERALTRANKTRLECPNCGAPCLEGQTCKFCYEKKQPQKTCPVCEWAEVDCSCGTSAAIPSKADKAKSDLKKRNLVIGSPLWKIGQSVSGTAKPYFFTQRHQISAGEKLTLTEIVKQIICVSKVDFKCDGPILLSNLIFGNVLMWPANNEIHIGMKCSFDIPNHPLNCGSQVQATVQNLDGAYSHELFIMYSGVTIE